MKISHEPAMTSGVVAAVLALLVGYNVLDAERAGLWSAFLLALIPIAQAVVTRGLVVPVALLRSQGRRVPQRYEVLPPPESREGADMGERP